MNIPQLYVIYSSFKDINVNRNSDVALSILIFVFDTLVYLFTIKHTYKWNKLIGRHIKHGVLSCMHKDGERKSQYSMSLMTHQISGTMYYLWVKIECMEGEPNPRKYFPSALLVINVVVIIFSFVSRNFSLLSFSGISFVLIIYSDRCQIRCNYSFFVKFTASLTAQKSGFFYTVYYYQLK